MTTLTQSETTENTKVKRKRSNNIFYMFWQNVKRDKLALFGMITIIIFIFVAIFADFIAPYDENEMLRNESGEVIKLERPSKDHLFGTTNTGKDIFSQVVKGTQTAMIVGLIAAILVTVVGTTVGVISGYFGGWVDSLLMRIVDIFYSIPFIPFVIVLVALLKPSLWNIILAVSFLSWRTVARLVRSQVLSIVKRPFVKAARVVGAGHMRIMFRYILPSVVPLALLEMAFMVNWAITAEASVAFLGFGDPSVTSWGQILQENFSTGNSRSAWWWVIPPGLAIVLLLVSVFFVARALEEVVNPRLRRR